MNHMIGALSSLYKKTELFTSNVSIVYTQNSKELHRRSAVSQTVNTGSSAFVFVPVVDTVVVDTVVMDRMSVHRLT